MSKYQKALNQWKHDSNKVLGDMEFNDNEEEIMELQELIDKETELESRKDKLVVGSEWVCIAECTGVFWGDWFPIIKGTVVKIANIENDQWVNLSSDESIKKEQFLLCFMPKEHFPLRFKSKEEIKDE